MAQKRKIFVKVGSKFWKLKKLPSTLKFVTDTNVCQILVTLTVIYNSIDTIHTQLSVGTSVNLYNYLPRYVGRFPVFFALVCTPS